MVISNHLRRMILSNKGNLTPVSNSGSVQEAADLGIAFWEHLFGTCQSLRTLRLQSTIE